MTRVLQPEILDELASDDPRALHSRRDLRRLNSIMGNARLITRFVREFAPANERLRIAEIGAGDGNIGLGVARAVATDELILVDRAPAPPVANEEFPITIEHADVFDWLDRTQRVDVIVANLFLHHFARERLRQLLERCAERCDCFVAAEPRRSSFAEWFARRVRLIGCNDVTQHDAVVSVRAGFNGTELSELWPHEGQWAVSESAKGLFTHFFAATRRP